jgi:carboxymethylenebutenolidase
MGEWKSIAADDGHDLSLYVARPEREPIASLVVIQEIFGVNGHIRSVADSYASEGFLAVAPALFDRVDKGIELGYDGDNAQKGMALMKQLDIAKAVLDVDAALTFVRKQTGKKAAILGFCFGGLVAWLSASRLRPDAVVGYYPGGIANYASEKPKVPVQLHFGRLDTHIPADQVNKVHGANSEVEINWYADAGHAFNCAPRPSYNPNASALARARTLAFLRQHLIKAAV